MNSDKMTIQKLLIELGFSEAEAETYWALLNLDNASVRKVAVFSGINRGSTYDAMKSLKKSGLAYAVKSGEREYYSAESPEKIYDLIRDRRKELMQTQAKAAEFIPELLAKKARPLGKPLVRYFEDDEGIVTILKDVLHTCGQENEPEYYAYSSKPIRKFLYRQFPQFTDRRVAEGINIKVIAVGEGGDKEDLSERRWLPEPSGGETSSYTIIYGSKVAHISISEDQTPYGVVIEDVAVAAMQRQVFEQIWNSLEN